MVLSFVFPPLNRIWKLDILVCVTGAFFDMYIGDSPICEQTKEQIGKNVASIIQMCWGNFATHGLRRASFEAYQLHGNKLSFGDKSIVGAVIPSVEIIYNSRFISLHWDILLFNLVVQLDLCCSFICIQNAAELSNT